MLRLNPILFLHFWKNDRWCIRRRAFWLQNVGTVSLLWYQVTYRTLDGLFTNSTPCMLTSYGKELFSLQISSLAFLHMNGMSQNSAHTRKEVSCLPERHSSSVGDWVLDSKELEGERRSMTSWLHMNNEKNLLCTVQRGARPDCPCDKHRPQTSKTSGF